MVANVRDGAALEYSRLLLELHERDPKGEVDSAALDAICDRMEGPWSRLTGREKKLMKGLSQDLYALADERKGVEMSMPARVNWEQQGRALQAADDLVGLLEHLRRPFPAEMPKDLVWFLQARCWERLGFTDTALAFMQVASRTLPLGRLACLHYLSQLGRREELIRLGESLVKDAQMRAADIYYVASMLFLTARTPDGEEAPEVFQRIIPPLRKVIDTELKKPPPQRDPAGLELLAAKLLAFTLYRLREYAAVVAVCSETLLRFPNDPGLLCARALANFQNSSPAAEADFERAVNAQPGTGVPYAALAWYRVIQGQYHEVLSLSIRALGFSDVPAESRALLHEWRGISFAELGQGKDWVDQEFAQALQFNPKSALRINYNWQKALEAVGRRREGHPARKSDWTIASLVDPRAAGVGIDPTAQVQQAVRNRVSAFGETERMSLVGAQ